MRRRTRKPGTPAPARGRMLLAGLVAIALAACTADSPDAAFERYLARLSRTLAVASPDIAGPAVAGMPPPRELHRALAAGSLDTLDFLALSGCEVQITIGKRNSSLGRMARDSQRLLLELEYLQLAPACIAYQRGRGETALANTLEQAWLQKRRQLPAAIYNATLGSSEYREFWQQPAFPAADYPANTGSAVIASLEMINHHARRWLAGDFSADNLEFELLLGEAATGDGGALLQALAAQSAALAAANRMLAQRMARGPLCSASIRPVAADILANVIRKFFIGDIQPRAAALNRRYHELLLPIEALEQLLGDALPPAYVVWAGQRDARLSELALAPRRHVESLQSIQQPCPPNKGAPDDSGAPRRPAGAL
ncbi:MAG: DUF3080 family protein [Halioglobus sp.]|nr:DUF3080 family protein [Halioglobus sp.]